MGAFDFQVIPSHRFLSVADRETVNEVAATPYDVQLTCCALNEPLRFGYGLNRVGALLLMPVAYGFDLLVPFIIGRGKIGSIDAIEAADAALPSGVTSHTYLGATSQAVDSWLAAAWAARGKAYTDTLNGIAWAVLRIPQGTEIDLTAITVTARMKVVYDPRKDSTNGGSGAHRLADPATWEYSTNPALALADFLFSTAYGKGETLDWPSVAAVANVCDQTVGNKPRRAFGTMFERESDVDSVEETLRTYAGCWVVREGDKVYLVADAPATSVFAFSNQQGAANYVLDSLRIVQRGRAETPTVVAVRWTDTTVKPWAARLTDPQKAPGVADGTLPWREQQLDLPGIQDVSQAVREARRRLNEYTTADLAVELVGLDPAIKLRVGDVVTLTDSEGFAAKPFRLIGHRPLGLGRWAETLSEYQDTIYSDDIATAPSIPDTSLPLPSEPTAVTGVQLSEELVVLESGVTSSRLRATWAATTFPFVSRYAITLWQATTIVATATVERTMTTWVSPPVQEGLTYRVDVQVVSVVGAIGPAGSASVTAQGKLLPPSDPVSITGFEAGGMVYLTVVPGIDIDILRHEFRYGTTGGSWATATLIDRADTLTYVASGIAAGTWRFYVKEIDSIGQYSANAKYVDVAVTLDAGAFLTDRHTFSSPTLTSMTAYTRRPDAATYWVTDFGDGLGYGADNTDNSVGTFGDSLVNTPFAHPHTAGTSSWQSEVWDTGQSLAGTWSFTPSVTDLSGTATIQVQTSPDNSNWTTHAEATAQTTARYVKGKVSGTGTFVVTNPVVRVEAFPREETGTVTTNASGATTVSLAGHYAAAKAIQLTANGTAARTAVYDNVVVHPTSTNSFDVYAFNSSGTQISCDVSWVFQGV
jgi:hypothetical protein